MTSARAALAAAAERLRAAGVEAPEREARLLLALALGIEARELALDLDQTPGGEPLAAFEAALERRSRREPFAYIAGRRGFWTLDLDVTPATLIPRPDTETLVEVALRRAGHPAAPLDILDMGTGSGAILIALLSEMPAASGFGVDVSAAALEVARRNAHINGVGARARFGVSSWWSHAGGPFDLVVSNPPYIPTRDLAGLDAEVREHEPRLALDGGPDGLAAYRAILSVARARISPGGALAVEIGIGQHEDVAAMFAASGFSDVEIDKDLGGVERVVSGSIR